MMMIQEQRRKNNGQAGFTLLEILIVLAIIVGVMVRVAPRLASSSLQIRAAVRHIASMSRFLEANARLRNTTYRLVIQMDAKKGYKYWVESAAGAVTVMTAKQIKDLDKLSEEERKIAEQTASFTIDKSIMRQEESLPNKLKFLEVEYAGDEKPIESGTAYVHYFPQGLAQEAAIHIGDGKNLHWTLAVRPLTGQMDVIPAEIHLKDLAK